MILQSKKLLSIQFAFLRITINIINMHQLIEEANTFAKIENPCIIFCVNCIISFKSNHIFLENKLNNLRTGRASLLLITTLFFIQLFP